MQSMPHQYVPDNLAARPVADSGLQWSYIRAPSKVHHDADSFGNEATTFQVGEYAEIRAADA